LEYQIKLTKEVKEVKEEDLPKLQKSGLNLEILRKKIYKLKTNPYTNSRSKSGDLTGIRALDWGNGYKVVFQINEDKKQVNIMSIDKHDDAYKKAKKRK
jgi:mRNA-degrading endonuclease RelE of RelBE toxin-antitoxin system